VSSIHELWQQYKEYTEETSRYARQLGFAAAGIAWVLKVPGPKIPPENILPFAFITASFFLDLMQYLLGAVFIGAWTRRREKEIWRKKITGTIELYKPAWLDYPSKTCWFLKLAALSGSYILLFRWIIA
jgi:hypothetical protein